MVEFFLVWLEDGVGQQYRVYCKYDGNVMQDKKEQIQKKKSTRLMKNPVAPHGMPLRTCNM